VPFIQQEKDGLNNAVERLVNLYAKCVTHGDMSLAKQQLKLHQRENIAWERDTVWRHMIGRERRGENDGTIKAIGSTASWDEGAKVLEVPTPFGRFKMTQKRISIAIAVIVFLILFSVQVLQEVEANRCLAILVFCTIMWATEVILLATPRSCYSSKSTGCPTFCYLDACTPSSGMLSCIQIPGQPRAVIDSGSDKVSNVKSSCD
jgi:phosphate transporter